MITIRRAKIEDLATVQQLGFELLKYEHDRWDDSLDLDWPFGEAGEANYRKAILERVTLLAEDEDKTAGFLIGSIQKPAPGAARNIVTAQLNNIFIREEWRGQRIGQQLAEEFKRICKAEQVEQLNVTVNSRNEDAIAFYEHIGLAPSRMFMSMKLKYNQTMKSFRNLLFPFTEEDFREFTERTIPCERETLGARIPTIRKLA